MRDIQRALNIEQEYINCRLSGEEPYALADKLAECGFSSVEEFYSTKPDYLVLLLNFEILDKESDEGAELTIRAAQEGRPMAVFCKANQTGVYHGDEALNTDYCKEHGIPVLEYHSAGGNIVITHGDMAIGLSIPVREVSSEYILRYLAEILSKYEDDVRVDKNDILVGDRKVAGSANYHFGEGIGFVIHFSFGDKSDLIRAICFDSNPDKAPGHLTRITPDQLRREVVAWLQKS